METSFIAEPDNGCIRKVGTDGIITTVAGKGKYDDGLGFFMAMDGLAINAYAESSSAAWRLTDTATYSLPTPTTFGIREVAVNSIITTVAGGGDRGRRQSWPPMRVWTTPRTWRLMVMVTYL